MARLSDKLLKKLRTLPTSTGVYLFEDASGKIIYIGKGKNLRNRVRTYFQAGARHDDKTAILVSKVRDFSLIVTDNEIESLILEANLVREHKPRYNILLKDDKHFPYLKITDEPFPRVLVVRRIERDGARYFGPYTSGTGMRRTYEFLTKLFKIRTCNLVIPSPTGKKYQVCLDYHINRCGGPCAGHQSAEEYAELVESVKLVLEGKSGELIERLTADMQSASEEERFERARECRDQIDALRKMKFSQNVDIGELVDRDIVSVACEKRDGVAVVLQIRQGALIGRQDFQLATHPGDSEEALLDSFVSQYYMHQPNLPDELFVPLELPNVHLLEKWLRSMKGSRVKVRTPRRGSNTKLVGMAAANARLLLDELLIQRRGQEDRTSKMVTALQEALKLPGAPRRIVCFDISNTGETDFVGSCVLFANGQPRKKGYRHFRIKGSSRQDDFAMMREIVGRYFHRLQREKKPMPDLVVVDGGKGQLSSALAELRSLRLPDQPIISLAKRLEEIYLPGQSDPLTIAKSSPALRLLKQLRDEAHRFAVSYNRKVRSKRTVRSALDEIAGVGPAKRTALLKRFGSVAKIKAASAADIASVQGINEKMAGLILKGLSA